ncbi:tRNA-splicing endonuclease subunit Sen2 [Anastrepha obliqua]|uniref:tRNA-splicing endonuclease subunit Sen2 n=1 Tax=Anastrepha obliqua TaxID=95512 RepID=UPI0024097033|nr:tRNA-splicing endonuclease subunit Sen2 [Anastrepha obliqua]
MLFTPIIKRKKDINKKNGQPFPDGCVVKGMFTGISVEVYSSTGIKLLYENGYYGKGSKSKGAPNVVSKDNIDGNECLTLELEESCFLSYYVRVLFIHDWKGREVQWRQFVTLAKEINPNFLECLAAYLYLKAKGWVIKSGIKFGGNFLIYKKGPRFNHASFIIFVRPTPETNITTIDLKGIQRIAETSDKDILLLEISKPNVVTLGTIFDIRQFRVSETIIRRFNSTSYVQSYKLK